MQRFSQRLGFQPVRNVLQVEAMDEGLRVSLWNAISDAFLGGPSDTFDSFAHASSFPGRFEVCRAIWADFLKRPVHSIGDFWSSTRADLQKWFFDAPWWQVYDFVEFMAALPSDAKGQEKFRAECNRLLERELSGYRFVGTVLAPITTKSEIEAIEQAGGSPVEAMREHIRAAAEQLANRKQPDYRNSIKESISAIEALVRLHAGGAKGDLGPLLTQLQQKAGLHPALSQALNKLYGYTSDKDGIRHAMLEVPDLGFDDAKFMLVICSAFANYVQAKLPATGVPP